MHAKLLTVVYLFHNTLLILISIGYLTALSLFWRDEKVYGKFYSDAERRGIVWPNVVSIVIALVNTVNGFVTYKKELIVGLYVYMTMCALSAGAPLSLTALIRLDDLVEKHTEEETETLVEVLNAFACAFFGSNFICFYNAFTMQYALRTKKAREANLAKKRTSIQLCDVDDLRQNSEANETTKDARTDALSAAASSRGPSVNCEENNHPHSPVT